MFNFIPTQLIIAVLAATPVLELNASIPYGILNQVPTLEVIIWSLIGNTLIAATLLILIKHIITFCFKHIPFLHRTIEKRLHKFNRRYTKYIKFLGPVFLTIFIVIPIPASGTYSSVLLADLFEMDFWPSLIAIFIGNIIYALLITGGFELVVKSFGIA